MELDTHQREKEEQPSRAVQGNTGSAVAEESRTPGETRVLAGKEAGQAVGRIEPRKVAVPLDAEALKALHAAVASAPSGTGPVPSEAKGQPVDAALLAAAGLLPKKDEHEPQMSLEQARALAASQRLPTRRRLDVPAVQEEGLPEEASQDGNASHSNLAGFGNFFSSILRGAPKQQTPDKTLGTMLRQAMGGQAAKVGEKSTVMGGQGLFAAMDAPLRGLTPEDIQYASDVDAAYSRRPKFGARFLSFTIFIFFGVLLLWSAFAKIDEVTHSEGTVVGSQRTQSISNLEGGILRSVLVREGQTVQKDDVLAQIDNEMAASSYRDAVNRTMDDSMAIIRLEAELRGEAPVFPKDLMTWVKEKLGHNPDPGTLAQVQQNVRDQQVAYESRKAKYQADDAVLRSQYVQRQRDVQEQQAHKEQLSRSLELSVQQRNAAQALVSRNNFSRIEYLGMEQKVVELKGQVDMLEASIPRSQAAAKEAEHRIESHKAEFDAGITEELNKRRVELSTLHETLAAGSDRVTRTDVRSPVRGIVKQIYLNTLGGVVKPGEPIMDVVPLDDTLLVEARVKPQDVAFLRPGQSVMVKVTAYDFSIYGGLEGNLEQISADTIEDKRGEFYYLVKVRTKKTYLTHHNEILPIIPGMLVQADILIGKKTILQYLMKPILKAKQNAMTER